MNKYEKLFLEKAQKKHGGLYDYSKVVYKTSRQKVDILCNTCSTSFSQRPSAHLQGQGCPICAKSNASKVLTKSQESFEKSLKGSFTLNTPYIGKNENISATCNTCNQPFKGTANTLYSVGCSYCNAKNRSNIAKESLKSFLELRGFELLSEEYVNNSTPVTVKCKEHFLTFQRTPNKLRTRPLYCPKCPKLNNRWSLKNLDWEVAKKSKGYLYLGKYENISGLKVGVTTDIKARMCQYKSEPYKFNTIHYIEKDYLYCSVVESVIKHCLRDYRAHYENVATGYTEIFKQDFIQKIYHKVSNGLFDTLFDYIIYHKFDETTEEFFKVVRIISKHI
ncbi:hypothetical protein [Vibrio phage RYC]|nr:hypothetical protein [Vibrio phage RYC]